MKVQVPGEAEIRAHAGESFVNTGILSLDLITNRTSESVAIYARGFRDGMGYCNELLEKSVCQICGAGSDDIVINDSTAVEPKWQPVVGQFVAAWGHNYHKEDRAVVGWYRGQQNADSYKEIEDLNNGDTHYRLECALIETLDEIGKPPQYFIERGRCTV